MATFDGAGTESGIYVSTKYRNRNSTWPWNIVPPFWARNLWNIKNIRWGYWIVLSLPPKFKTYCTQRFDIMSLFDLTRISVSNLILSWNGADFLKICPDSNCVTGDDNFWSCAFCELCGHKESPLTLNVVHWIMLFVANRCENRAIWFRSWYLISQKVFVKLFFKQSMPAYICQLILYHVQSQFTLIFVNFSLKIYLFYCKKR